MFDFSPEQKQIRTVFRRFIDKEIEPHNDAMEAGRMTPYEPMRKLGEMLGLKERAGALAERIAASANASLKNDQ